MQTTAVKVCIVIKKFKIFPYYYKLELCKKFSSKVLELTNQKDSFPASKSYFQFHGAWPKEEQVNFIKDMCIIPQFLTLEEEKSLLEEIDPYLQRMRYEFDHWDDAIHGYRETERKNWYPKNRVIIQRVCDTAFNGEVMPFVHVLDLAAEGVIKPHVDSTRYCGTTIAGLSLLSDSVMRLVRTNEEKFKQENEISVEYRNQIPKDTDKSDEEKFYVDILLKRYSLYIMSSSARYNFTHEILKNENAYFKNDKIVRTRRISIICRNEPNEYDKCK